MKRGSSSKCYLIKPDLFPEDRLSESNLLKKRWDIINSGIPKVDIKLGRPSLYFKKSLHGRVVNGSYIPQHSESLPTNSKPTAIYIARTSHQSNDGVPGDDSTSTSHIAGKSSTQLFSSTVSTYSSVPAKV